MQTTLTEEQIGKLKDIKSLRSKVQQLERTKFQIGNWKERLKTEDELLKEIEAEREILLQEKLEKLQELQAIQKDIAQVIFSDSNLRNSWMS